MPPAPQDTAVGGVATIIEKINWNNPSNPAAIPVDFNMSSFLLDTKGGLQIWNVDSNKMVALQHPLSDSHLLDGMWLHTMNKGEYGTLFAVTSPAISSLYWLFDEKSKIEDYLNFPSGFSPSALVQLTHDLALVCATVPKRTLIVHLDQNGLKLLDAQSYSPNLFEILQKNSILGLVDGVGEITEKTNEWENRSKQPIIFDTPSCSWKARFLPEPLASAQDLVILKQNITQGLTGERLSISAASWRDPKTNEPRMLDTPLFWNWNSQQWQTRKTSDYPIMPPDRLSGVAHSDWIYSANPIMGKFAFLESTGNRWRESTQSIPISEGLKLLPIKNDGVLALLIDSNQPGRVVRLFPEKEKQFDTRLNNQYSSYNDGSVSLSNGDALLIYGGQKLSNASLINTQDAKPLPDLPQAERRISGAQLFDGSIVIFGGLPGECEASHLDVCSELTRTSYHWIQEEKKWQALPTLNVPFAYGINFGGGNSSIFTRYPRNDFLLHNGKELYYLTGDMLWMPHKGVKPSSLYRWKPDIGTEMLAATQVSRSMATLIELDSGNLAAIGGFSADESPSPACQTCQTRRQQEVLRLKEVNSIKGVSSNDEDYVDPEQIVPQCEFCRSPSENDPFVHASSCEIYDPVKNVWRFGPYTNHPGGRAVKLANGRIFKFGLLGWSATDSVYAAETADPAITQWVAAPPFPFSKPAEVELIQPIGNQVLIVMAKPQDRYVIWDDASKNWQVHPLPRHSDWGLDNKPQYIGVSEQNKLLMIYERSYEYLDWPLQ